jgi:transglutaminase-like putative cysteine protease
MRFSVFSQATPSKAFLLDAALLLALLPHLFTLKLPMLVYLLLALLFILKKKSSKAVLLAFGLLGPLAIAASFFADYNFTNFSRLLVFVSVILSLLIYALVLQRLTRSINFYLLISPALLMVLSFFFYNSIGMLFYALFTLFCFTFLLLYARMKSALANVLRINTLLYLFSLPLVVLLFLSFPRISYKNASFGFKAEIGKRTGHDGTMYLDSNALLVPSPKLVMEVSFDIEVPPDRTLYFRGSTLYVDKGTQWERGELQRAKSEVTGSGKIVNYSVKLYPHHKRWLYMLDVPLLRVDKSRIDQDFITLFDKPLEEIIYYEGRSALNFSLFQEPSTLHKDALSVDTARDNRSYEALQKAVDPQAKDEVKAAQLMQFFSSLNLSYSLKPKETDLAHPVDSFLFDSKVGYCVHFAAAFANSARMVGLPSRIVTGYKADRANSINNYLLVKESDAHAWVELYLNGKGWTRFEPTASAKQILSVDNTADSGGYSPASTTDSTLQKLFKQANIYYMYSRYIINAWVLNYTRSKQMALLDELLNNTLFLLKFVATIAGLVLVSVMLFVVLHRREYGDPLVREMQVLMRILKKEGFVRASGETMSDFLQRVAASQSRYSALLAISALYHQQRYGNKEEPASKKLRAAILAFKKSL